MAEEASWVKQTADLIGLIVGATGLAGAAFSALQRWLLGRRPNDETLKLLQIIKTRYELSLLTDPTVVADLALVPLTVHRDVKTGRLVTAIAPEPSQSAVSLLLFAMAPSSLLLLILSVIPNNPKNPPSPHLVGFLQFFAAFIVLFFLPRLLRRMFKSSYVRHIAGLLIGALVTVIATLIAIVIYVK